VENALLRVEVERVRAETVVLLQRAQLLWAARGAGADGVSDVDAGHGRRGDRQAAEERHMSSIVLVAGASTELSARGRTL
jgi:hypothetical protein